MAITEVKCNHPGFCCDKGEKGECVAAEDFQCADKVVISDDSSYQQAKQEGRVSYQ